MAVEDAADLATFFNTNDFAIAATYSPEQFAGVHPSSKSRTVNGIFDRDFIEINGTEAYAPVFDCSAADVSDVSHGARLTINGAVYIVRGNQPDGTGITRLILESC